MEFVFESSYFYMMENRTTEKYIGKSSSFIFALVFTFIISTFIVNIDFTEFAQRKEIFIPNWFFFIIFTIDLCIIGSLVLIYFYRKLGVYLFPIAVFLHFFFHNFYLSSFLYFDLFLLFLYFLILLVVIPRWPFFK